MRLGWSCYKLKIKQAHRQSGQKPGIFSHNGLLRRKQVINDQGRNVTRSRGQKLGVEHTEPPLTSIPTQLVNQLTKGE